MTTYAPPTLPAARSRILPVRWCKEVLWWAGWIHERTMTIGGYRTYICLDPAGRINYLTTYGLRQAAYENYSKYWQEKTKNRFTTPLITPATQGTIHT